MDRLSMKIWRHQQIILPAELSIYLAGETLFHSSWDCDVIYCISFGSWCPSKGSAYNHLYYKWAAVSLIWPITSDTFHINEKSLPLKEIVLKGVLPFASDLDNKIYRYMYTQTHRLCTSNYEIMYNITDCAFSLWYA